ncbi:SUKH-4 family immunity protein [Streptomyces sviceus]|uniref:SUKH-4 family immunity protein n=1 Tax=Streptomyces sviceus TaxID=285530 RepID=UPI0036CE2BF7
MVTFAQAQERAEEWINGDVPSYQHREVRVREFDLGFVVWAEDRAEGPRSDGGAQRLVIARDSGEATLWPSLPVGEVIRRYEEEYGREDGAGDAGAAAGGAAASRVDLNQTSFLLTPPEWLQDAADKLGIAGAGAAPGVPARPWTGADTNGGEDLSVALPDTVFSAPVNDGDGTEEAAGLSSASSASEIVEVSEASEIAEVSEPLDSRTARIPRGGGSSSGVREEEGAQGGAPSGGSPYGYPQAPGPAASPAPPPPGGSSYGYPQGAGGSGAGVSGVPAAPRPAPSAGDIADVATSRLAPPSRGAQAGGPTPPPPPGPPGVPGAQPGGAPGGATPPPVPGAPGGGYVPTQFVSAPGAPQPPGRPSAPVAPTSPSSGASGGSGFPGAPGGPGAPQPPGPPGPPGLPRTVPGAVQHAETVLSPPPGAPQPMAPGAMPPPPPGAVPSPGPVPQGQPMPGHPAQAHPAPGQPPAYGYPQQSQPTVGPGYQAVLRYRAQDGSEQQLIRRSAPGTPHPEWQIFHELRGMNVPPDQVLELHTELESCELPGAYCARMIREQWPQARIASIAPYGTDHASRQQGMQQLLAHQGELHQVADGPARPAPVRAPLPPVQAAPPIPPEGVAEELASAFGPGIFRFEQVAVDRQGVPPVVAHSLVVAGLPFDMGPFFWAQAQPGRPVPTLAELAAERGVQPASDAGSYLVMGSDFGKAVCVQYGTANIVAVPVEAGPGGAPVPPQFVNTGLPEFQRCLALLGRMWRLRFGLNQEQAGRWTVDFQAQLASLDPAALGSPESWWSVLLEQMWDGLL